MSNDEQQPQELIEAPSYQVPLAESGSKNLVGLESMADLHQIAYAKMVQSSAKPELKDRFAEGTLIVTPQMVEIIPRDEQFHFVPLFSYREYTIQNPIGIQPFILEKSNDFNGELAMRARNRDIETRKEPCPEAPGKFRQYVEHLNYVIVLLDHDDELYRSPVVVSFFKGEWKRGVSFKQLLSGRQKHITNICCCRFQASISLRRNQEGNSWWGLDIVNPEDGQPFLEEEVYQEMLPIQKAIADSYQAAGLDVNYEYDADSVVDAANAEGESKY